MNQAIYRKYRPQKFSDLVNQEHVRQTLENEIKTGRAAQAYLFTGPRGTGKTTTARLVAKATNCLNRQEGKSEPCGQCHICQAIKENRFLDLIEIDAASNRGINEIRELRERVRFAPSIGRYKVFIIDEVHMLTPEAFNALLKTLEEPPAHAIFILATTEPHKIPETIISRCQRFDFKKVRVKDLVKRLEKIAKDEGIKVDKEVLKNIALRSEGCVRDAESLLQQVLSLGEKEISLEQASLVIPRSDIKLVIEFVEHLFQNKAKEGLDLINKLVEDGVDLEQFSLDLIEFLRQVMVYKINPDMEIDLDEDSQKKVGELAGQIENSVLTVLIEAVIQKKKDLRTAEIFQLPLELLVLEQSLNQESDDFKNHSQAPPLKGEEMMLGRSRKEEEEKLPSLGNDWREAAEKVAEDEPQTANLNGAVRDDISIDSVKSNWQQILSEIKKHNHSILGCLKTSEVISFNGYVLEIGLPYKFHQERIEEAKNKAVIEACVSKILGQKVKIEVKIVEFSRKEENLKPVERGGGDEYIKEMLETFGGELVEE